MKKVFVRKLTMYDTTVIVVDSKIILWENKPAFVKNRKKLVDYIKGIRDRDAIIEASKKVSKEKKQAIQKMLTAALVVCGAGSGYAGDENNEALKFVFVQTPSSLKAGTEGEVLKRCKDIAKAAEPIKAKLEDYNMPQEQVSVLNVAISVAEALLVKPHVTIKSNKTLNKEIADLFHECDVFLVEQFDKMMMTFIETAPDFLTEYTIAREIGGWRKPKEEVGTGSRGDGGITNTK